MKKLLLFVFCLAGFTAFSQNCNDFMSNARMGVKYPYKFDNQSKTGLYLAGKSTGINLICQEGKDYSIKFSISTNIAKDVSITITDESGKEYFTYGASGTAKDELAKKKELMISFENQSLTVKGSKAKLKLQGDMDNLKLEIEKMEQDILYASSSPKTSFEFTPASTMNMYVKISLGETKFKGCVTMIVTNKPNPNF